jgi:beta-lactamase superfamily II metal-dependent hydrolase
MSGFNRRTFIRAFSACTTFSLGSRMLPSTLSASVASSSLTYEPWKPGLLDIHHISTGRGNSTLFLCPDGTSMMVDAGAIYAPLEYTIAPKPDNSRRPGEWLGRYAKRHLAAAGRDEIDYFILTHFHADHMGEFSPQLPLTKGGSYRLTGVSDVAEIIPIRRFLDRNYPDYNYPTPLNDVHQMNYINFIREQVKRRATAERFHVGSGDQIRLLRDPARFPEFSVRNLVANGEVWTGGSTDTTRRMFPELNSLTKGEYPTENMCSLALRMSFGKFDYYTGGDLTGNDNYGKDPWRNIEGPVAKVAGPVEVAIVNHHGYADADGPDFVRGLRPQVFILLAWDSAHPTVNTLGNMLSTHLYPEHRDIFATAMKQENQIANRRIADLKSQNGHVVVRVAEGGASFRVIVLDNRDEQDRVIAEYGPYRCN